MKLDERVEIRISTSDKKKCEQLAREANLPLSEWMRRRVLRDGVKGTAIATIMPATSNNAAPLGQ